MAKTTGKTNPATIAGVAAQKKTTKKKTTKKKVAAKKTVAKKPGAKKAVAKKTAQKKTAATRKKVAAGKKVAAKKKAAVKASGGQTKRRMSGQERHQLIAEAAYLRSEAQGFFGDPREDWLFAEAEIDARLSRAGIKVVG